MQPVIKKESVRLGGEPRRPAPERGHSAASAPPLDVPAEPLVRLIRAGGAVHALEVRCAACGERTLVELEFGNPPSPASPELPESPEDP